MMLALAALRVYVFFATWCVPCRHELPEIARLERELAGRGVEFVLVSLDGPSSEAHVEAFVRRFGVAAPIVIDSESELVARFDPTASVPFVAVVDDAGRILYQHAGYEPGDEVELARVLTAALAARRSPPPARRASAHVQTVGLHRRDDFRALSDPRATGAIARLDLRATSGAWDTHVRGDGAWLAQDTDTRDARVEKAALGYARGGLRITAGDGYAGFGRGLALSVRKVDPLGVDTTVRGTRFDLERGRVAATALAGQLNPQNIDPIALRELADPGDWIAGVAVREVIGGGRARLEQAAVVVHAPGAAPDGRDVTYALGGGGIEAGSGGDRVALEAIALARRGLAASDGVEPGGGIYALGSRAVGRVTIIGELKGYRRFFVGRRELSLAYHEPPSLERDDQEVPGNEDAAGARARIEWRTDPVATMIASATGYGFALDGRPAWEGGLALHGYAGLAIAEPDGVAAAFSLGYRHEAERDGGARLRVVQLDADVSRRLGAAWAGSLAWDHRSEVKTVFGGPDPFQRGQLAASLTWTGRATVSALYGYSTEAAPRPIHYPGGELRIELGARGDLRVFAGRLTGGRICVSGACRDVPPFEGARAELTLRL